jgi:hypothetical protein
MRCGVLVPIQPGFNYSEPLLLLNDYVPMVYIVEWPEK